MKDLSAARSSPTVTAWGVMAGPARRRDRDMRDDAPRPRRFSDSLFLSSLFVSFLPFSFSLLFLSFLLPPFFVSLSLCLSGSLSVWLFVCLSLSLYVFFQFSKLLIPPPRPLWTRKGVSVTLYICICSLPTSISFVSSILQEQAWSF